MITIIYGCNQLDMFMKSLPTLKQSIEEGDFILAVDNGSTDGTYEWLQQQEDIDIIYFDEGEMPYSQMMNAIIKEYEIMDDDILFLNASYMLTNNSIHALKEALEYEPFLGIVAPASNHVSGLYPCLKMSSYEIANQYATTIDDGKIYYSLGVDSENFLVRKEIIKEKIRFDEKIYCTERAVEDFALQAIMKSYKIAYFDKAVFFEIDRQNEQYQFMEHYAEDIAYMRSKWKMQYFNKIANYNLVSLIDQDKNEPISVLEVGCDCGATLIAIKNIFRNAQIYGLELNAQAVKIAGCYMNAQVQNIEDKQMPYSQNSFDYIIFGDVLEHLRDPEATIRYCREFLKENGCILTSIPNLMNVTVLKDLINGNFTYTETGLLDKTHIHMFTYNEIVRMFSRTDYRIEAINSVILDNYKDDEYVKKLLEISDVKEKLLFDTFQYVVKARALDNLVFNESPVSCLSNHLNEIANKSYNGVYLWKYLIEELAEGLNHFQDEKRNITLQSGYSSNTVLPVDDNAVNLLDSILSNIEKKDILFAMVPLRRIYHGKFEHTALDSYIDTLDDNQYAVLEPMTNLTDEEVYTKNRLLVNLEAVPTKYGIDKSEINEVSTFIMENIVNPLCSIFKSTIPINLVINKVYDADKIMQEHRAYVTFFTELLQKMQPKVICYTHGAVPWICYLHEAAQKMNIPTVEIAHGAISKNMVYPNTLEHANYYLTHSKLEEQEMRRMGHQNVYTVGKPGIFRKDSCIKNEDKRIKICFISSVEQHFFELMINIAQKLSTSEYVVFYKAHTSEQLSQQDLSKAKECGVNVLGGAVDVRDVFQVVDIVVGIRSSALVDALPYEKIKVIMVNEAEKYRIVGNARFFQDLVKNGEIVKADYVEEVYREIKNFIRGKKYRSTPNSYWPEDSDTLFRDFIQRFL